MLVNAVIFFNSSQVPVRENARTSTMQLIAVMPHRRIAVSAHGSGRAFLSHSELILVEYWIIDALFAFVLVYCQIPS
jgi:hypothetical protein